ncbi:MAG: hypothetical protein AAB909_04810 [Patescibacteria group bacterium]
MGKAPDIEDIKRIAEKNWPLALPLFGGLAAISAVVYLTWSLKRRADAHKQKEIDDAVQTMVGINNPGALLLDAAEILPKVDPKASEHALRMARKMRGPNKDAMEVIAKNAPPGAK